MRASLGILVDNSRKVSMKIFLITLLTLTISPSMGLAQSQPEGRPHFSPAMPQSGTSNLRSSYRVAKVPSKAESAKKQQLALGMKVFRATFLDTCQTNTPPFLCQCTLEGLEAEFTAEELLFKKSFSAEQQKAIEARQQPIFAACFEKMRSET